MRRAVLRLGRRALLHVLRALTVFGSVGLCTLVPPYEGWDGRWAAPVTPERRRRLCGPSAGHPERLCGNVPLTAAESDLAEQLAELADLWPESAH
ncbi:DUF6059 family protein [Streptacidiphilus sp. MAP5-3]|uniref:DUF6059 family protein n=1 Tax=unclassified Streptacidiphilus TaxID=2643834 RepID=UPI0035119A8E